MKDDDLCRRVLAQDDSRAENILVDRHQGFAMRYLRKRFPGIDFELTACETLLQAILYSRKHGVEDFRGLVATIARRLGSKAKQRMTHRQKIEALSDTQSNATSPQESVRHDEMARDLVDAMEDCLTNHELSVVILHYSEGYTAQEIAKIVGTTPDAVKSCLHRARRKLKTALNRKGHE